jgi:uncharacterized protein (TIGR04551 family)
MHRFSRVLGKIAVLVLLLPALAQAQAGQGGGGGNEPAPPAAPPATSGEPAAPPTTATPPAPGAPTSSPATPTPPVSGGGTIDRSSLLPPAPASRAPAQPAGDPRDNERKVVETSVAPTPKTVYAEDWWVHSRPVFELHGGLRVRAELLHNFALGRVDKQEVALWPQPVDNDYSAYNTTYRLGGMGMVGICGDNARSNCEDKSQAGANMRFRVNPELHISDNLRVMSQIDMLENLVLGSTPGGYNGQAGATRSTSPYVPIGAFASTQVPPTSGFNSLQNSINIRRAWGEYATPVGQLRFGRMPNHWGLGMLENSGDSHDSDWQSTVDRIMFTTGVRSLDLYVSGSWDFPNEGPNSAGLGSSIGGQPYDLAQLDDVNQYTGMVARRRNPELAKLDLARGEVVVNGGVYFQYRDQLLAYENAPLGGSELNQVTFRGAYRRRGLKLYTPDLWFQLLYKKFRFEVEGSMIAGSLYSAQAEGAGESATIRQFGLATQTEWKAVEDRLRLQFGFGWSSGDSGVYPDPERTSTLSPTRTGSTLNRRVIGNRTYSQFRFHPDYRVDLILHRNILGRVQGDYYFRPSIEYDFTRNAEGQKLGGGAAIIWTRASEFMQTPGHKRDLGIELNLAIYYQSKDGSLNDNPDKMGGFFTSLQYGVLFPLGGLGYLLAEPLKPDTAAAHTLRWFMGILF